MRRCLLVLAVSLLPAVACVAQRDAVSFVNPLIGTQRSALGYGGTMPLVTAPFGMTDWTAQTRQNKLSVTSYNYGDRTISGFIGTHQPAIWMGDYGYVTLAPEVGELKTKPEDRRLPFRHQDEMAGPDYYSIVASAGTGHGAAHGVDSHNAMRALRFTFRGAARRVSLSRRRARGRPATLR